MKCLSLKQPFAELVVQGRKTIELRSWNTRFRGRFLVHASSGTYADACHANGLDPACLPHRAIVGSAVLYDVKEYASRSDFINDLPRSLASSAFSGARYGFMLKDARKLDHPIQFSGRLGLFDVDASLLGGLLLQL